MSTPPTRAETGPMQFGDDWRGVFFRGKHACYYAMQLGMLLDQIERSDPRGLGALEAIVLRSLVTDLSGANHHSGPADGLQKLLPIEQCVAPKTETAAAPPEES